MNEREEQIRQRLEDFKAELNAKSILPVRLGEKETQQLMDDVAYLLEVVSNLRKGNVINGEPAV